MVTRNQIDKLTSRIDALTARFAPKGRNEAWIVERDQAWPIGRDRSEAISVQEMRARPCSGHRIELQLVHNDRAGGGWLAACCLPGGECYALHGESGGNRPPGWTEPNLKEGIPT